MCRIDTVAACCKTRRLSSAAQIVSTISPANAPLVRTVLVRRVIGSIRGLLFPIQIPGR